ncbi:pathogenesis-related thaumatin-like protein 3.5, partial [Impatiens glandulifera]|uniref:pathogenesis-related thaumatin-like protein 3.5 n=1 Tax=Impatiens glandulifera TaxID=253017 RepID=UPI001FB139D2
NHFFIILEGNGAIFTLQNSCNTTIWPGILAGSGPPQLMNGGLQLNPGDSVPIAAPSGWSGRFWGRTGCLFDKSGKGTCVTGDCGGAFQCAGTGGTPPATLVELTLDTPLDFYDVSLVDGYNIPISITPLNSVVGCKRVECLNDLNKNCPRGLEVVEDGRVVACKSACLAFNQPEYCCTGVYNVPSTCKPSNYSRIFKSYCPSAYSYAYDDASSIFTCSTGANYLISFC